MGIYARAKEILARPNHNNHAAAWSFDRTFARVGNRPIYLHFVLIDPHCCAAIGQNFLRLYCGNDSL